MDNLTYPGVTPAESCSSEDNWLWVVEAGCIAKDLESPMFAI